MKDWRKTTYPAWYNKAIDRCHYEFRSGVGGKEAHDAFKQEWVKYRIWEFYQWYRRPTPKPLFYADYSHAPTMTNGRWQGLKEACLYIICSAMNSTYWSRYEYEEFDEQGMEKVFHTKQNGRKVCGFYAEPDDPEIEDAWEDVLQWFIEEPWLYLPGRNWENHRMEQL